MRALVGGMSRTLRGLIFLLGLPLLCIAGEADELGQKIFFPDLELQQGESPGESHPESLREALERDIEQYRGVIQDIEVDQGPYAMELSQQLESLGTLYERTGRYRIAIECYERAWHIIRINNGLFAPEQGELVRRIIRNHIFLKEYEEVRRKERYLVYIRRHAERR